jgi:hypothetical protein
MELVLPDIANWKTNMQKEISEIDRQLEEVIPAQIAHLKSTRATAVQKIKECETLLNKMNYEEPVAEESTEEVVEAEPVEAKAK